MCGGVKGWEGGGGGVAGDTARKGAETAEGGVAGPSEKAWGPGERFPHQNGHL